MGRWVVEARAGGCMQRYSLGGGGKAVTSESDLRTRSEAFAEMVDLRVWYFVILREPYTK